MGYLSFQIIFFLLLAALLGFGIGWLLRGSRFQTELQDLDGRWRTKLGEVESERDRFGAELTQSNEAKAKLETDGRRLAEAHESSLQQLKRDHQAKLAAFADSEKTMAGLKADLASKDEALAKAESEVASARQGGGDAERLGRELAAANERGATLDAQLQDAKTANASCKSEVDRLKGEIAELKRSGGGASAPSSGSGPALGLISGGGGSSSGSDSGYGQRAASPTFLAEAGGQGFASDAGAKSSSDGPAAVAGPGSVNTRAAASDDEGERPPALGAARDGKADDLKKISGVGPKLEGTLNGLGIFHFSQIAEFTPAHVAWVDRHLRFKGRIARENWLDQAKTLAAGGETEFSKRRRR